MMFISSTIFLFLDRQHQKENVGASDIWQIMVVVSLFKKGFRSSWTISPLLLDEMMRRFWHVLLEGYPGLT